MGVTRVRERDESAVAESPVPGRLVLGAVPFPSTPRWGLSSVSPSEWPGTVLVTSLRSPAGERLSGGFRQFSSE